MRAPLETRKERGSTYRKTGDQIAPVVVEAIAELGREVLPLPVEREGLDERRFNVLNLAEELGAVLHPAGKLGGSLRRNVFHKLDNVEAGAVEAVPQIGAVLFCSKISAL